MIQILIKDNRCKLKGDIPIAVIRELDEELSFKDPGRLYIRFFGHGWDGATHLLDENLIFPYGLLNKVVIILSKNNLESKIIDSREKTEINTIDIIAQLNNINKQPRDYQVEVAKKVFEHDCGVIKLPTGTGKTILAALMIANLGKKSIYYVTGTDLLYQAYNLFKDVFNDHKIGIMGDGLCETGFITIASIWTVGCALGLKENIFTDDEEDTENIEPEKYAIIREEIKQAKTHVIDECSYVACNTIQEIYKNIIPEHIYGTSASPWRDTGDDLLIECVLGNRIVDLPAQYFIDKGFLIPPVIKFVEVPKYYCHIKKYYKTIYKTYIVENEIKNNIVFEETRNLVEKKYKVLVLYSAIKHGKILYEIISKEFPCMLLAGKDKIKVRNEARRKMESGEIQVILASKIFDLGMDCPILSGLVLAGGGKSSVRALQRVGRVLRPHPQSGKKFAAVVDFIDDADYLRDHSLIRKSIYEAEKGFTVIWPKNSKIQ